MSLNFENISQIAYYHPLLIVGCLGDLVLLWKTALPHLASKYVRYTTKFAFQINKEILETYLF